MTSKHFLPFPVLKTERLILRQLLRSDDHEIFALRSDNNVNKYLDRKPSKSIEDAQIFIQTINENIQRNESIYWAITTKASDKLIGTICLYDIGENNLKAELGFELLPNFQQKGIMQEAIKKVIEYAIQYIRIKSIEAYTHSENQPSIRLLEKLNFKRHSDTGNNLILLKLPLNE